MSIIKNIIKEIALLEGFFFHHNRKSKVIYYHDVGIAYTSMGTPFDTIQQHISIIRSRGFEIVSNITQRENQIMIAFDDGWKGLYDNRDFFVREKIFPTVFIAVDLIGKDGYMNKEEIMEMHSLGFQFESHTWTHTGLHKHVGPSLEHETKGAKKQLESILGFPFTSICYPQGMFSKEVYLKCAEAGYKLQYTCVSGCYYDYIDDQLVCRNLVQYTSARHLKYILEGDSYVIRQHDKKLHFIGPWPFVKK